MSKTLQAVCDICGAEIRATTETRRHDLVYQPMPADEKGELPESAKPIRLPYEYRSTIKRPTGAVMLHGHDVCAKCYAVLRRARALGIVTLPDVDALVVEVEIQEGKP